MRFSIMIRGDSGKRLAAISVVSINESRAILITVARYGSSEHR
jgi:hypothetical protein